VLYSCDLQGAVLLHTEHQGFLALSKELTNQFAIQTDATAAIGEPEQANKALNMIAGNNRDHTHDHSIIACSLHTTCICVQFFAHNPFVTNHAFNVTPRGDNKIIHCKFFAQTGFLLGKVQLKLMMSHSQQLFTLQLRRLRRNNDTAQYIPACVSDEFSRVWGNNGFFHGVAEKNFPGGQQW